MSLFRNLPYDHPYRWDGTLFGGPKLWRPDELGASLSLWLDAEDTSTITLNGSNVSQWSDKSGNNNHAVQAIAVSQPAYLSTGFNGKPAVSMDGSDDFFIVPHADSLNMQVGQSIQAVLFQQDESGTGFRLWQKGEGVGVFGNNYFASPAAGISIAGAFSTSYTIPYTPGTPRIMLGTWDETIIFSFVDGALNTPLNVNNGTISNEGIIPSPTPSSSTDALNIGRRDNPSGSLGSFQGLFCEIVFCSGTASTADRQKLEGYLAWKWGLEANLPADHPYKSTPPLV